MTKCKCGHEYDSGTDDMKAMETRHVTCPACGETHLACALWPGWPFTAPPEPTEEQRQASQERTREFWQNYHRQREEQALEILLGENKFDKEQREWGQRAQRHMGEP